MSKFEIVGGRPPLQLSLWFRQIMSCWELILDGAIDGENNMAMDAGLLDQIDQSSNIRTIVRFYGWRKPTISLGRNQKIENAVDAGYCLANGIDIVHRPTGGRAVLHD